MKIQQHDGMVVDAAVITAGLRQASARGRGVAGGEGGARGCGAAALPPPTIYRPPGGGAGHRTHLHGGGGQGGCLAPKASGGAPSPRVPNPRRMGGKGGTPAH